MLGPVMTAMRPAPLEAGALRSQLLATKPSPRRASAASTTGWRPASISKRRVASTCGFTQLRRLASSASAAETSMTASASEAALRAGACASIIAQRSSKMPDSIASARSAAEAILDSSSDRATVEKRMAPAMVWRWMKVALRGSRRKVSPSAWGTSRNQPRKLLCLMRSCFVPASSQ